jgi:tRNA1Val (adenine37-N6)-methyltransferase
MGGNSFSFKQFTIKQEKAAFKVGTDGVLLGAAAKLAGVRNVLDIGSGTGLIAIMIAQRCNAEIVALEPDHDSYLQCLENVSLCRWKERISVENVSLQDYSGGGPFDLIITNPPFFSDSLKNPDPRKSASRHNDNLTHQELLQGVSGLLAMNGSFQVIMPYAPGNVFISEAGAYGLFCNSILKIRPLPGSEIRRLIMTFSSLHVKPSEKFLTIEHGIRHDFTEEYRNLTKEFYLKF